MTSRGIWVLVVVLGVSASAQSPKPQFEVASVKASSPVTPSRTFADAINSAATRILPDGLAAPRVTVHNLILLAYDRKPYQIVGDLDWVKSDSFEINARAGTSVPADQIRLMTQSLLEDRFKLVTHTEQREMQHQALVIAKPGKRLGTGLFRMDVACTPANVNELRRKFPEKYASPLGNGVMSACSPSGLGTLADILTSSLGTPVIDGTGLDGPFYFALSAQLPRASSNLGAARTDLSDFPALSTALEEQLGLKLESRRGPIEVLVIDSVSRPTEN